jgi:HPt (histidine-containing phosphotransfer) domain-containing protein
MSEFTYLDADKIRELLYGEEEYIRDFCEAATESFTEFKQHYEQHLLDRNEKLFRNAGHKIKPVAQMVGADEIVEEYEHGKALLLNEEPQKQLQESVQRVKNLVEEIIQDFNNLL